MACIHHKLSANLSGGVQDGLACPVIHTGARTRVREMNTGTLLTSRVETSYGLSDTSISTSSPSLVTSSLGILGGNNRNQTEDLPGRLLAAIIAPCADLARHERRGNQVPCSLRLAWYLQVLPILPGTNNQAPHRSTPVPIQQALMDGMAEHLSELTRASTKSTQHCWPGTMLNDSKSRHCWLL